MMSGAFDFPSSSLTSSAYPRLDCSYSRLPCSRMPASHTRRTPRKPSCLPRRRRHSPHTRPYRWVQCCVTSIDTPFLHSGLWSYAPTHCRGWCVSHPHLSSSLPGVGGHGVRHRHACRETLQGRQDHRDIRRYCTERSAGTHTCAPTRLCNCQLIHHVMSSSAALSAIITRILLSLFCVAATCHIQKCPSDCPSSFRLESSPIILPYSST